MTRDEAIEILKAFMENPLFSDVHKAAFTIAIHDIKQRHEWDINNLILINKDDYEPLEQEPILDKYDTGTKTVANAEETANENILKGFEEFTKMMFKQGQAEREEK